MAISDGSNLKGAVDFAKCARSDKAGSFHGGKPPPGPKKEPSRLNGVPAPKERGVSKK
jgi:hypothetical protein